MTLRTMNDVRKWLLGVANGETPVGSVNYIEGRYSTANQLLNIIGRDAAPDPWEAVADRLAKELYTYEIDCMSENALAAYRKLKEESREQCS